MKGIFVNGQWQGGGNLDTYYGANELLERYLSGCAWKKIPVSLDQNEASIQSKHIKGFDVLRKQMHTAHEMISGDAPDRIFTLGGGCDADVPAIVYLNEKYHGDLTILWLDAHGDLNAPEESASALFYGMPLRSVMDASCFGLLENPLPIKSSQIIHIGGRDFDDSETKFITASGIQTLTVREIRNTANAEQYLHELFKTHHIYIHLDLDVLDPAEFSSTPLPVANGLKVSEVLEILESAKERTAGIGIYEYIPCSERIPFIEKLIHYGSAL